MTVRQDILNIAAAEVGYSRWDDPEAGSKYGRWYAGYKGAYFGASGVPFCDMFVSWVLFQAGVNWLSAYVPGRENEARQRGVLISKWDVQPGDLVTFDWQGDGESDHIGIARSAPYGSSIDTYEGNTSPGTGGPQGNGGYVAARTRDMDDVVYGIRVVDTAVGPTSTGPSDITGVQRALGAEPDNVLGPDTERRLYLVVAASGWAGTHFPEGVAATQAIIGTEADGIWGEASEAAHDRVVESIQRALGVDDDGVWGPITQAAWESLASRAERP